MRVKPIERDGRFLLQIEFEYDRDLVEDVKENLDGRWWDPDEKCWFAKDTEENRAALEDLDFEFDGENGEYEDEPLAVATWDKINVPLRSSLFEFQKEAIGFLAAREGKGLVAFDMGLGKTICAIAWLKHSGFLPAVVVCPASIKENWRREIDKFSDLSSQVLYSKDALEPGRDVYVLNPDILDRFAFEDARTVIFDESSYYKSSSSKRFKLARALSARAESVVLLTGTPILNRPKDLWSQTQLYAPKLFPSFYYFAMKFCDGKKRHIGDKEFWDFNGASNLGQLKAKMRNSWIRRTKEEVLSELPAKQRITQLVSLFDRSAYEREVKPVVEKLRKLREDRQKMLDLAPEAQEQAFLADAEAKLKRSKLRGLELAEIEKLRQATVKHKLPAVADFVETLLESEEKVIVFAHHHVVIDALRAELSGFKPLKIDGRDPTESRMFVVDEFQKNPEARVLVGSIQAAGYGLNLTAARVCVFAELSWNPSELEQCEARLHRIGQTGRVISYYLVAARTIEERMAKLLDAKLKVIKGITEDVSRALSEEGILDALVDSVCEEER